MLVHTQTQSLVLKVRNAAELAATVPESRVVPYKGVDLLQARHTPRSVKVLRNMGFDAPSPLRYHYDWPGPFPKPFDHQYHTSDFMVFNPRGFILNDMGTGKTQSVLWAADYLMRMKLIRRCIVVAPKSTCRAVWEQAVKRTFFSRRSVEVLVGSKRTRLKRLENDADFYVINHDGIKTIPADLADREGLDLWVLDEASEFTNPEADRFKVLRDLTPPTKLFWVMTATPVSGSPVQAWALAKLLRNGLATMSQNAFKLEVMNQVSKFKWLPKPGSHTRAFEMLQPAVRFKKEDCLDLPEVTYQYLHADLSKKQKEAFQSMQSDLCAITDDGEVVTAQNAAGKLQKLLQICCGQVYSGKVDDHGDKEVIELDPKERLSATLELCQNTSHNAIVFVPYTSALNNVAAYLKKRMPAGTRVHTVDGSVADGKRAKIFDEFENKNEPGMKQILVAHPKVAAHGLTLVSADLTVWYGPVFSLDWFIQANERMNRPGQVNKMTIAMLAGTLLENQFYGALERKSNMQAMVLQMFKEIRTGSLAL